MGELHVESVLQQKHVKGQNICASDSEQNDACRARENGCAGRGAQNNNKVEKLQHSRNMRTYKFSVVPSAVVVWFLLFVAVLVPKNEAASFGFTVSTLWRWGRICTRAGGQTPVEEPGFCSSI